MSLGILLPLEAEKNIKPASRIANLLTSLLFQPAVVKTNQIELFEDLNLIICNIQLPNGNAKLNEKLRRKIKRKLDAIFYAEGVWSVLEHPSLKNLCDCCHEHYDLFVSDIGVNRFLEILRSIRGVGNLNELEVTLTGNSMNLEYAIAKLITSVKSMNILLPEGSEEPEEAESAFEETGIPVHITTDPEVLNRTSIWVRFPNDHESFDTLPSSYKGFIVDLGVMKVIDTKAKKILNVSLELPDKLKKKMGIEVMNLFDGDHLSGFLLAYCINAWGKSPAEVSNRLGIRLSLKP